MPSKAEVLDLVTAGCDYFEIGWRLGIPPGRAYLIGTGLPADGGDTVTAGRRQRPGVLTSGAQRLVNPRQEGPAADSKIGEWIRGRALADAQMRQAATAPPTAPPPPTAPRPADAKPAKKTAAKKTGAVKTADPVKKANPVKKADAVTNASAATKAAAVKKAGAAAKADAVEGAKIPPAKAARKTKATNESTT